MTSFSKTFRDSLIGGLFEGIVLFAAPGAAILITTLLDFHTETISPAGAVAIAVLGGGMVNLFVLWLYK